MNVVEIFKVLGDENRIRILNILTNADLCVCEIETILGITQSNASRHLIKLKNAGLITCEKKSQWVTYKTNKEFWEKYECFFDFLTNEISKYPKLVDDKKKLFTYKESSFTCKSIKEEKIKVLEYLEGINE